MNSSYRDFVLTRMAEAKWPGGEYVAPLADAEWTRKVTLVFEASRQLGAEARRAVERDYGMKNGRLKITVREAMKEYQLAQLRMSEEAGARPRHLDLVE